MSAEDRIDYLLGKAVSGDLQPSEKEELDRILASDPGRADAFIRDSRFGAFLSLALEEGGSAERFERALRARHHASGENAEFIKQLHRRAASPAGMRSRVPSQKRARSASAAAWWGLAAAVLLALGLIVALVPGEPDPVIVQRPEAPETPEAPPVAPVPPPAPARSTPSGARAELPEPPTPKPEPPIRPVVEKPETPPPAPKPEVPKPPTPKPEVPRATRVAAATVEAAFGRAFAVDDGARLPLKKGDILLEGQSLFTWGVRSRVEVKFGDETRLQLHGNTALREVSAGKDAPGSREGKRFRIERGSLTARVPRQPRLRPMIIDTPRGEVKILGTTLRLHVDPSRTRLEVMDGRVRLTRKKDRKFIQVNTGQYAVAAEGVPLRTETLVMTRTYQDGAFPWPDFGGTEDTFIFDGKSDRKFGSGRMLEIGGPSLAGLFRWNLSDIPRGSKVEAASLSFRVGSDFPRGGAGFRLYEIKRPWVEGEANWKVYAKNRRWQRAGAEGSLDRGSRVLGVLATGDGHNCVAQLNAAGLAVVQSWIRNPSRNNGIVLVGDGTNKVIVLASSESPGHGERPALKLRYTSK